MDQAGIRELKQNASAVVAAAAAGDHVVITDRGRPVAQLGPMPESPIEQLLRSGRLRPAKSSLADLPAPEPLPEGSPTLGQVLERMRADERY